MALHLESNITAYKRHIIGVFVERGLAEASRKAEEGA